MKFNIFWLLIILFNIGVYANEWSVGFIPSALSNKIITLHLNCLNQTDCRFAWVRFDNQLNTIKEFEMDKSGDYYFTSHSNSLDKSYMYMYRNANFTFSEFNAYPNTKTTNIFGTFVILIFLFVISVVVIKNRAKQN